MTRRAIRPGVFDLRRELGRAPTVAEFRATRELSRPVPPTTTRSNGCDCYDPECYVCCDDEGDPR